MSGPRQNVERKYRCADLDAVRRRVAELPIREHWTEDQLDTYFLVAHGRLKLREVTGQPAILIHYHRPDRDSSRICDYRLVPVADAEGLRAALTGACGVRVQVRKRREIHLFENVRIHLDEVDGLGRFVEFEAVLAESDDEQDGHRKLAELAAHLELTDSVPVSYADLTESLG